MLIFKILLAIIILIQSVIRIIYQQRYAVTHAKKETEKEPNREKWLVRYVAASYFIPAMIWLFTDWLEFAQMPFPDWLRWVGFLISLAGVLYFYMVHQQLGDNWSPVLEIRPKHELIITGLYKYIMHPMYSSMTLGLIGMTLLGANWLIFLVVSLATFLLFVVRIPDEEQLMIDQFGKQYQDYRRRTKRLIPYIF